MHYKAQWYTCSNTVHVVVKMQHFTVFEILHRDYFAVLASHSVSLICRLAVSNSVHLTPLLKLFLCTKLIPIISPTALEHSYPALFNTFYHISLYLWPLLTLSIGSPLKGGVERLFNRPEESKKQRLWKDKGNGARGRRSETEKEKGKDREPEVGLEGDAPLLGWQTEGPSRARQMRRRGGERERGERKGGEFDVGSQPHHPPTASPLFLHPPSRKSMPALLVFLPSLVKALRRGEQTSGLLVRPWPAVCDASWEFFFRLSF